MFCLVVPSGAEQTPLGLPNVLVIGLGVFVPSFLTVTTSPEVLERPWLCATGVGGVDLRPDAAACVLPRFSGAPEKKG